MSDAPKPQLWALLVGINEYTYKPLKGCVQDVDNVHAYILTLETHLVTEDHIRILKNTEGTRANILKAYQEHLIDNKDINDGDAILFHYSGHGTQIFNYPESWKDTYLADPSDAVECICPYDSVKARGEAKEPPIPDRTLGALANRAATLHGGNVLFVFDSCHSGHGLRDENNENAPATRYIGPGFVGQLKDDTDEAIWGRGATQGQRSVDEDPNGRFVDPDYTGTLYANTDANIWSGKPSAHAPVHPVAHAPANSFAHEVNSVAPAAFNLSNIATPLDGIVGTMETWDENGEADLPKRREVLYGQAVLMAACHRTGTASDGFPGEGGAFTSNWVKALRDKTITPRTYQEMHKRISPTMKSIFLQEPQCEGPVRRVVFEKRVVGGFPILTQEEAFYKIGVPEALGVRVGDVFELLDTSKEDKLLGSVRVTGVDTDYSVAVKLAGNPGKVSGDVRAFLAPAAYPVKYYATDVTTNAIQELLAVTIAAGDASSSPYTQVASEEEADVAFKLADQGISYTRPKEGRSYPLVRLEDLRDLMPRILSAIGRFIFQLDQQSRVRSFAPAIDFRLFKLQGVFDPADPLATKIGAECPFVDGAAVIAEDADAAYTIVLENTGAAPLYPYLFYFDPGDHSIAEWYSPQSASDPPLAAGATLRLGATNEWPVPYELYARDGVKRDTGYLKLLVASQYLPLSSMIQEAVFDDEGRPRYVPEKRAVDDDGAAPETLWESPEQIWDHPLRTSLIRGEPSRSGGSKGGRKKKVESATTLLWDTLTKRITVVAV